MVSDNPRQPSGSQPGDPGRTKRRRTTYSWTADSDWLTPPTETRPEVEYRSSTRSRPAPAPERTPAANLDPQPSWARDAVSGGSFDGGLFDGGLFDDGSSTSTMTLDLASEPDDDALALFAPEWDDDELDSSVVYGERPWDRMRERIGRRTLIAVAAAFAVVAATTVFVLRADDGDSADLATIGDQSSTTVATEVGDDTGIDSVRTGPDIGVAATDGETTLSLPTPVQSDDATADETTEGTAADGTTPDAAADSAATGTPDGAAGADTPTGSTGAAPGGTGAAVSGDYSGNLGLIQQQTIRNRNEDDSPYRETPSAQLVPDNHYGPRSDYLGIVDGNIEPSFPVQYGGQFRVACEFSHFAYDDPLVYPNQPGASHLHMFFGNTDTNAYSTADSIKNSGGSTCNGSELNRTGYWVPAMFDGDGNVRIPERVVVYYKGEGLANGNAEVFPDGAAMIASTDLNTVPAAQGGAAGKFSYNCSNNYSGVDANLSNTIPACAGTSTPAGDIYTVLEVNVKFPQCWNGQDPGNPANFRHPTRAGWYGSLCDGEYNRTLVNLEYFVNYRVEPGESTADWYLSSDVSPTERTLAHTPGSTNHGDWWSGWHNETNKMFIDNCVNYSTNVPSGCGFGYLTDGGPDNGNPYAGPALALREQYLGPMKVSATELHTELCPNGGNLASAMAAAFCTPAAAGPVSGGEAPPGHTPLSGASPLFCPVHRGMLASDPASPLSGSLG